MESLQQTASEKNNGPMLIEVIQYDDESRLGSSEVVSFDITGWDSLRMKRFWEFLHDN